MTTAYDYAHENFDKFMANLKEWLMIPSVSTDPAFKNNVRQAAEWLAADMHRMGLSNVEVMPTDGYPVVYGEYMGAGEAAPTILIYGHYDVQPAVIEDGWDSDPFKPVERDGLLYARGATDDKGQTMIQMKALESMLATGGCPVNLKYLIEGEEEIGSPNLAAFVEANKDKLAADLCLISDTAIVSVEQPALVYSLRGLVELEVVVTGPKMDLHSGGYGGIIHNPAQVIAEIVAQLHDAEGRVTVPGFYDDVLQLSDEEREQLAKVDFTDDEWQSIMGDLPEWGETAYSKIERVGARPTLEINGIGGGYVGEGLKTVLPARANAKISCRLVANQDPEKIMVQVRDYILSLAPKTAHVEVVEGHHGYPAFTPLDHPAMQAAARAYAQNWDNEVLYKRGGGSIPIVSDFQNLLDVPVVLLGFGLPDCQAHGPNESFNLEMYRKGIRTVIAFMHEIAAVEL